LARVLDHVETALHALAAKQFEILQVLAEPVVKQHSHQDARDADDDQADDRPVHVQSDLVIIDVHINLGDSSGAPRGRGARGAGGDDTGGWRGRQPGLASAKPEDILGRDRSRWRGQ